MPEVQPAQQYLTPSNGNGNGASVPVDGVTKAKQKAVVSIDLHSAIAEAVLSAPVNMTPLQPVTGTILFNQAAGTIPAGQVRTAFQDQYGESTASGIVQSRSLSSFVGGRVPNGQIILLHGFGAQVVNSVFTAQEVQDLAQNISLRLNLRGTEVKLGAILDWPAITGAKGVSQNGSNELGRRGVSFPSVLQPEDTFTLDATVERATAVTFDAAIHFFFKATRIYDRRVLGLS